MTDTKKMTNASSAAGTNVEMFSFGDPESVIDGRDLWGYFEMYRAGHWYEPPLPMSKLAKTFNASPHHRSCVALKVNLLVKHFVPTPQFSRMDFEKWAIDFLQMGNGYVEGINNIAGRVMAIKHSPSIHTRVGTENDFFWFVKHELGESEHQYAKGSVFHIMQQRFVLEQGHLDRFAQPGPPVAIGQGLQEGRVVDDGPGRGEGADEVLGAEGIDAVLDADASIGL